ncbi:enoyl-coenzyme A hydratase/3-hydroxyacyl coenzyme A dehydrogenase [Tribonema minus]|uniref:Enoyl-coenzyme A hydratase/3-hydroxyacyl coenzyme A dehydrogenase n=1 Tax=Tribonema minus TaxID=303371 RepID=A0A835ZCY2_9STRA|nr:enoyl-coenzyme A hydratase/3-hydroxyacyl coenzyme A dehydrogenase [Tribonema minus]
MTAPPLNPLSHAVRQALMTHLATAEKDPAVQIILITGAGTNFSAGADIKEMADLSGSLGVASEPQLTTVVRAIEACNKPVIAAIDGFALGGGCEVALSCHYRVASPRARLGLPEVKIGLIPGAGGTQRLPRLVPIDLALHMITTGATVKAGDALQAGLVDHISAPGQDLIAAAVAHVRGQPDFVEGGHVADARRSGRRALVSGAEAISEACAKALAKCGAPVMGREPVWSAIEALRAAAARGATFEGGLETEGHLFSRLLASQQSRGRRHLFLAEREASRMPAPSPKPSPVKQVGIIGAGTMGSGIAIAHLMVGLEVVLVDANPEALQRGVKLVQGSLMRAVKRGKLSEQAAMAAGAKLKTAGSIGKELSQVDMVIEAVVEKMELKKAIFKQLDDACRDGAVLCTNTSTLDVDAIAAATRRPHACMGMHFFSPAQAMPLVECVRGRASSPHTIATTLGAAKRLGKVGVLVGNCDGFVGNRMLKGYQDEVLFMLEEGATPRQIDTVMRDFGMLLGPLETSDLAGNDISWLIRKARGLTDPARRDPGARYCALGDALCEAGRFGQKVGRGWYRYDAGDSRSKGKAPQDDPEVAALIDAHRRAHGVAMPRAIVADEIAERCLLPMLNEAFLILGEGIADRPGDIDVVWVYGYAWPVWKGGPMFWADELGLDVVLAKLRAYGARHPDVAHWRPAPLLEELVARGETSVMSWQRGRAAAAAAAAASAQSSKL